MKRLFVFILMLIITGCVSNSEEYPTIQDKLSKMTSYQTNAEISYISNKGTTVYTAVISAKSDGRYRIDITSPPEYKGNIIMYDGKLVWQYNPRLENNKISANPPDKASRREIILYSFMENYAKSMNTSAEPASRAETVLQAELPGGAPMLCTEKLFIDNKAMLPLSLVIYDNKNNERIVVKFSNFEYNLNLEDDQFKINQ